MFPFIFEVRLDADLSGLFAMTRMRTGWHKSRSMLDPLIPYQPPWLIFSSESCYGARIVIKPTV